MNRFINLIAGSFKGKVLVLIVGILLLSSAPLVISTLRDFQQTMISSEEEHARNILQLILMDIENQYKSILFHKETALRNRKEQMVSMSSMVVEIFDRFYNLQKSGVLSEKEAKKQALQWVKDFRYYNDDYFFVFDHDLVAVAHPDRLLQGKNLTNLRDTEGVYIIKALKEAALAKGGDFTRYKWIRLGAEEPSDKIAYALYYPKWQWIIGTGLYIDDIEQEAQRKLNAVIEGLQDSFKNISIAKTGYLFLFDGNKKMIIHPKLSGMDISMIINPASGKPLADDLIKASQNNRKALQYLWDKPSSPGSYIFIKESYVMHFKPLDWYLASSVYRDELTMPARRLVYQHLIIITLIMIASISIAYIMTVKVTEPLNNLSLYTRQLVENNFSSTQEMQLMAESIFKKSRDEIGVLAANFIHMEQALKEYILRLQQTTADKEKIESELNIAREIQMSILPKIFPPFPNCPQLDIYAMIEPAKEVGGDFYDFFFLDERHFCFVIGDVSGKGVPASLFMAVTKTMIKATAMQGHKAEDILTIVNRELSKENDSCMFVTLLLCILETDTGIVSIANAGHNPPLLITKDRGLEFIETSKGIVLGAVEDFNYQSEEIKLNPGELLFLYTDGVTEAANEENELYGEERLRSIIQRNSDKGVRALITASMEDLVFFAGNAPQSDDITFIAMQYKGKA